MDVLVSCWKVFCPGRRLSLKWGWERLRARLIPAFTSRRRQKPESWGPQTPAQVKLCHIPSDQHPCTANEGPMRIQYKCLVPIYVFPEMKLLFPKPLVMFCLSVPTLTYLWEIYIFPGSVCLFFCWEICGLILGIYKSLTDTWMWVWLSQKRNT